MPAFKKGDEIEIPCAVEQGAFPTEVLVSFNTVEGPVSGFVRKEFVSRVDQGGKGYIRGIVREVSSDVITVLLKGSFFTTTGLASLPRDWANKHVQMARAA